MIWDFGNLGWKKRSIYQLLMNLWRQFMPVGPRLLCRFSSFRNMTSCLMCNQYHTDYLVLGECYQFEEFQMKWAFERLQRHQKRFCMFNDDIQGLVFLTMLHRLFQEWQELKQILSFSYSIKMYGSTDITCSLAFLFLMSITVKRIKPYLLLGLSGVGGIFNEQVLEAMRESDSPKPAIFVMSNPTMNAECTAVDAFNHAGENIVFASGNPFKNVDLGNGKVGHVNQANNMYLFPGIGMGALLSGWFALCKDYIPTDIGSDSDLVECVNLRAFSNCFDSQVGAAVVRAAVAEELVEGRCDVEPRELG
ncbi:hypothetical protein ACSBR1_017537 [Camellia fascicularis]